MGKHVTLSHYVDANLYHDMLAGQSVTGVIHFVNKCPIDWYSKKQSTVETATFGSKSSATRTATEQIIDLRSTLRYLGVPIRGSSYMFGDNMTVVDSGSLPHAKLHKRHRMLSYHCVREAIASGIVGGARYQEAQKCVEVKIRENNLVCQWGVDWSANPR